MELYNNKYFYKKRFKKIINNNALFKNLKSSYPLLVKSMLRSDLVELLLGYMLKATSSGKHWL